MTVELDLGLALDMAGEVTAHAPGGSGVVEPPNQVTAEVAPSRVERSDGLENMACGNGNIFILVKWKQGKKVCANNCLPKLSML